ncbi:hypothetical protein [Methyloversatilis discipulorum]|uniref:hypothetical protein n=1 Tax=Methyloversatilis discipulorum TaxID=1119528 RepID=UPI00035FFF15|nr:hypothetical protein [Methyloversatilis discipulorum]
MFHLPIRVLLVAASVTTSAWAADPADPAAPTRPLDHRSVFETYRAGSTSAVGNWREANDVVGRQAGGHAHDHGGTAAAPPDRHAGHDHGAPSAADAHTGHGAGAPAGGAAKHDHGAAGGDAKPHHCPHHAALHESMHGHKQGGSSGAMKPDHGHRCHHGSKEGGDAHKH